MPTVLVFPASFSQMQFSIPTGSTRQLGTVDVYAYSQIRVVAFENAGSPTDVKVLLTFASGPGGILIGPLDTLTLTPGTNLTRVYDVPGTALSISVTASAGKAGQDGVGLVIFGR